MKTVKINYAHVEDYFDKEQNLIYDILKNHGYDVQISSYHNNIRFVFRQQFYQFCIAFSKFSIMQVGHLCNLKIRKGRWYAIAGDINCTYHQC